MLRRRLLNGLLAGVAVPGMLLLAGVATPRAAEFGKHTIKFAFQNQKGHPQAEGAQKFAARGTSRPRGAGFGGEMQLDAAFASAPRTFGEFVGAQWRRFRGHDTFQQF